ncbi:Cys-rich peptide, Clo7bot family [Gottschalkia purinilytica]|uniref:Cys-rich peptide, Clo7bot family n=1 Tax=Gottschalkia purinilytica TaxID=1503 RepID=A0A0L0WD67_GOTPU|nr:Clo7bot family Cys-rich peptide [Gottschalkia purinilytica]KNF09418.1 Cys-rich peptide, Clo7bot family [Gottschalkia purinilytica]
MKYVIKPLKAFVEGYCYMCREQCQNLCGTQCGAQNTNQIK